MSANDKPLRTPLVSCFTQLLASGNSPDTMRIATRCLDHLIRHHPDTLRPSVEVLTPLAFAAVRAQNAGDLLKVVLRWLLPLQRQHANARKLFELITAPQDLKSLLESLNREQDTEMREFYLKWIDQSLFDVEHLSGFYDVLHLDAAASVSGYQKSLFAALSFLFESDPELGIFPF